MPKTAADVRAQAKAAMKQAILDAALRQLAETGADGLSVRGVARELGMASSAIYRHIPSRDALLTDLIIEGYESLGQEAEAAERAIPRSELPERFSAVCHAARRWATANPHHYALLYGSPVPGYAAPTDTIEPATRVARLLAVIMVDAANEGAIRVTAPVEVPPGALEPEILTDFLPGVAYPVAVAGIHAWSSLFGMVSFELFGHMVGSVADADAFFDAGVALLSAQVGL